MLKKFFKNKYFVMGIISMAIIVTISNILVVYPIGDWLTYAAFTYPIAFFITDLMNRILGVKDAKKVVFVGFMVGVILSIIFADPRIALASGTAFLTAQLLDILIFVKLKKKTWWKAPLVSSLMASAIDTVLFFSIAFYGTQVPWVNLAIGDYFAKLFMAIILLVPFRIIYKKLDLQKTEI